MLNEDFPSSKLFSLFTILLHNAICVFVLALALARIHVMHWTGENEGLCSLFLSYYERVEDDKIVLYLLV